MALPSALVASALQFLSVPDHFRVCCASKALSAIAKTTASWHVIKMHPTDPGKFWHNHPDAFHRLFLCGARPRVLRIHYPFGGFRMKEQWRPALLRILSFVERLKVRQSCLREVHGAELPRLTHL